MIQPKPEEFDALCRCDFATFLERCFLEFHSADEYRPNFHIYLLCSELEKLRRGEQFRLNVNLPPRGLKSFIASVAFVAWLLGHDPTVSIMCVSYAQDLSESFARLCREIMSSDWYRRLFPARRISPARSAVHEFETTAGGRRLATSFGGSVTGFGADYIIIDDGMKPEQAHSETERPRALNWCSNTLFSRLNDKATGRIINLQQRLHEDDITGAICEPGGWPSLVLPAIAQEDATFWIETPFGAYRHVWREGEPLQPDREGLAVLAKHRREVGEEVFCTQYLQMPTPPGGGIIKVEWFPRYDLADPPRFERIVQSWDTASKSTELADYSVCTTWGCAQGRMYLVHVLRRRFEYPDLKAAVIEQARLHGASKVLIEDCSSGIQLIQELQPGSGLNIVPVKVKDEKVMRARAQTARIEAGLVFLPSEAPWLADYLHEVRMFPGRYKDQVDSTTQAIEAILATAFEAQGWFDHARERYLQRHPELA